MFRNSSKLTITFAFILLIALIVSCGGVPDIAELEGLVLEKNWQEVYDKLGGSITPESEDVVAKMLLGHACLAVNQNQRSLPLFMSIRDSIAVETWANWTDSLLINNAKHPIALYLYADSRARLGLLDEAVAKLTRAIRIDDSLYLAYYLRGALYTQAGEANYAMSDFNSAIEINPEFAEVYFDRASLHDALGEIDEAMADYTTAARLNPDDAKIYVNRGMSMARQGQPGLAISDYDKAIEKDPEMAMAYFNKAETLRQLNETENAIATYEEFLKHATEDYESLKLMAQQSITELKMQ